MDSTQQPTPTKCPDCQHPISIHTVLHGCTHLNDNFEPCMCEKNQLEVEIDFLREELAERERLIAELQRKAGERDERIASLEDIIGSGRILDHVDGDILVISVEQSHRYFEVTKLIEQRKKEETK